jgi:hypothetical protein
MRKILLLVILVFSFFNFACSDNVKKNDDPSIDKNSKESQEIQVGSSKYTLKNIYLLKDNVIEMGIKNIPLELRGITNGMMIFEDSNVTIISLSEQESFNSSTNTVITKMDVLNSIFSNIIIYKDEKNSNEEILRDINVTKFPTNSIKHQRSYIIELSRDNKSSYILISEYKIDYSELEDAIIATWEDVCWDKTISVNITDKFANLMLQRLRALRTNKFVYF